MKRVISCVLLMLVLTSNAFALEVPTDTVVQNLNGSQQAIKTFTVSPEQDPAALIEEPFELEGYLYTFADIVKSENPVEEKRIHTEVTSPSAFRYAVRYEGHTDLAPYEFFECCNEKSDDEILGAAVQHYDVVEIDDGIKPAFFYKTEHGYELLFSFDAKTAKKNIREEID